jgi:hypothetical protein
MVSVNAHDRRSGNAGMTEERMAWWCLTRGAGLEHPSRVLGDRCFYTIAFRAGHAAKEGRR